MRTVRAIVLALAASSLLASAASARSISSSSQNIRVTWAALEFSTEFITVRCPVTFEGSFHARTIAKVARSLIGFVTRATIGEASCVNGRARAKALPWHITYEGFAGTLPNISGVHVVIRAYRAEVIIPAMCTGDYGVEADTITGRANREAGGAITTLEPIAGRNTITLERTISGICPASGRMLGSGSVTVLNSNNRVTITLI